MESLIYTLILGAVAGWLAGVIMKGRGFGIIGNILVGIVGAILGGYVFSFLGISLGAGLGGVLATATCGAIILLALASLLRRA